MYREQDFAYTVKQTRLRTALGISLILAFLALVILLTLLKLEALQLLCAGLGFIVCYFIWSFKIMPWINYNRYMKDMRNGQKRKLECVFREISSETGMHDRVEVRDVTVTVDETGVPKSSMGSILARLNNSGGEEKVERQFKFDADKSFPDIKPGEKVVITSYGSFITDIKPIRV